MAQLKRNRRGRGEGLIHKRPDGRWEARIDLGWQGGKRQRKSIYGRTREEVKDSLIKAQRDQQQGLLLAGPTPTVGQFIRSWLEVVKPTLRPATYVSYEGTTRLHILPDLERVRLDKLTPVHLHRLLQTKAETGLSPRSVQYILLVLRIALGRAVRWGLVPRNVAKLLDAPRVPRYRGRFLMPEEAERFIEVAREDRLGAIYTVALSLGLRLGEALGLKWSDVNLKSRIITIERAVQRVSGKGLQFVPVKTDRSSRTIRLPGICEATLRRHQLAQVKDRLLAGSAWQDYDLVFASSIGTPLDGRNVTRRLKALLSKAGVEPMRFHDLRHSAASLLGAQGVPPRVVMEILGHSRISVTLDLYSHVFPSSLGDAADAMDRALGGQFGGQPDQAAGQQS
jgi:integrase